MTYRMEELGVQAYGDSWIRFCPGRHPRTGAPVVLGSLARGGAMVIEPRTQRGVQIRPPTAWTAPRRNTEVWAIAQAPDGAVYQATSYSTGGPDALLRWNWEGTTSDVVYDLPTSHVLGLDAAPDGRLYLADTVQARLFRFTPATRAWEDVGAFTAWGTRLQSVWCAPDGWVYLSVTDFKTARIVALDPHGGAPQAVAEPAHALMKDGAGHVLAAHAHWGQTVWRELKAGRLAPLDPALTPLTRTETVVGPACRSEGVTALAFADGAYVRRIEGKTWTWVEADGRETTFSVEREEAPLRIFSVAEGGGKIWGGTFIPLTLFSYDPQTDRTECYGNPTPSTGEIYNLVWSRNKLFLASYTDATLTRYAPDRPWMPDATPASNPAQLGRMKDRGRPLQRPHGKALAPDGTVFFAAHGGYGCADSGICRIDPDTETVTRWIYPDTDFYALCYLEGSGQLLVSERRKGEPGVRFTLIDATDGRCLDSALVIADEGAVISWLPDGGDLVYGLHDWRATLFAYSLSQRRIVGACKELGVGHHCHNALVFGPDDRIWGYTHAGVYAVDRALTRVEPIGAYADRAGGNFYRFGFCYGPDGRLYFPNGPHLMRIGRSAF